VTLSGECPCRTTRSCPCAAPWDIGITIPPRWTRLEVEAERPADHRTEAQLGDQRPRRIDARERIAQNDLVISQPDSDAPCAKETVGNDDHAHDVADEQNFVSRRRGY
jgi:hypothetical protein